MKIVYKLLDNGTAVILTRQPEIGCGVLSVDFLGAPAGATAIFESGGNSLYRELEGVTCSVPIDNLDGTIKVMIAILDGSAHTRKWSCEELLAKKEKNGGALISPNDMNLPQRFTELVLENEDIRRKQEHLECCVKDLEDKLEKLLEGYDLI